VDDLDAQARALSALASVHVQRGEHGQAWTIAERLREVAGRIGDPAIVIVADRAMANSLLNVGRIAEARQCLERVLRYPAVPDDRRRSNWQHSEHRAMARALLARALWLQGLADQACAEAKASLDELRDARREQSLCRVLYYGVCRIAPMIGEFAIAEQATARLVDVAARLDMPFWKTVARLLEGKLLVARGEFAQGASLLRDVFKTWRATGWRMSYTEFRGAYAEALAGLGRTDEALEIVNDAIAGAGERANGQWWYVPELLRIKGEVLLQQRSERSISTAEKCFEQAGELAREQGALTWELRIALSIHRLRVTRGRSDEGRRELATIYQRFTEGFGTTDLMAAKQQLDALDDAAGD
jgi:tetratricopeptide (TPR) repeat protein